MFRSALREGTLRPAADLPPVDLVSLETLFAGLNSADDNEVLAAMDLLAEEGRARLIPALILYHPSQRVVRHALDLLAAAGRTDFLPVADRLLRHADPEIRAAALRARTIVAPDEARLRAAGADANPLVRATAVAGLVAAGWAGEEAGPMLESLLAANDGEAALALARAIAAQPTPAFAAALLALADSPSSAVLVEVARAMGALRRPEFLPPLLGILVDREARSDAREALLAYGAEGLAFLDQALADRALPIEIRRHLPRTVSLFPAADAAAVLQRHLLDEPSGAVRYRLLRGMNRLAAHATVSLRPGAAAAGRRADGGGDLPADPLARGARRRRAARVPARDPRPRAARAAAAGQGGAGPRAPLPAPRPREPGRGLPGDLPRPALDGRADAGEQPGAPRERPRPTGARGRARDRGRRGRGPDASTAPPASTKRRRSATTT